MNINKKQMKMQNASRDNSSLERVERRFFRFSFDNRDLRVELIKLLLSTNEVHKHELVARNPPASAAS